MLGLIVFILIKWSKSQKILEYRPGVNYGQILKDYSNNGLNAVSGLSSAVDTCDVIPTDRGCFIDGSQLKRLTLPANDISTSAFTLPSSFMIAFWILVDGDQDGLVLFRSQDSSNYFYLRRSKSYQALAMKVVISGYSVGEGNLKAYSFIKGKFI